MNKATIYDYARMCKAHRLCGDCPVSLNNNKSNLECVTFAKSLIFQWQK